MSPIGAVIRNVDNRMRIAGEEIFGPLHSTIRYKREAALRLRRRAPAVQAR
jgi:acyl-CoA reductase-like NAD-dependent aldehyde dehydrogenase